MGQVKVLSSKAVEQLKKPGRHPVGGCRGLTLQVSDSGARSWILRIVVGTKRRHIGLGAFPEISLARAREKGLEKRAMVIDGIDPIAARKAERSKLIADQRAALTFDEASKLYIAKMKPGWKNEKHAEQWTNTLATYASPVIGKLLVRDIEMHHVLSVLEPYWTTTTETMTRVRGRMEDVIGFSDSREKLERPNPARWSHNLEHHLAAPSKVAKVEPQASLPYTRLYAFMQALRARNSMSSKALQFLILTAQRTRPVILAEWSEIDWDSETWESPAEKMKMEKPHRTPLSPQAVKLLRELLKVADGPFIFHNDGKPLSNAAMLELVKGMHTEATPWTDPKTGNRRISPHGFRSTFKVWATEATTYPSEMSEIALAHKVGDAVFQAYQRSDMIEKRRKMMASWASYIDKPEVSKEKVVPINSKAAVAARKAVAA